MGSQSAVMMKMAGEQWQYGKRRISAMTNEEFNKLTPIKLYEIETSELRAMIPLMQESMRDMNKLTPIIVTEMIQMFKDFILGIYQAIQQDTDATLHPLFNWMLSLMGFPQKNIGSSLDFDNLADKFNPPQQIDVPFPTPVIPKRKPRTVKEIAKTIDETTKAIDEWRVTVPKGVTRGKAIIAIKKFKTILKTIQTNLLLMKKKGLAPNRSFQAQEQLYIKLIKHWQQALSFINKQGKSGATT